MTEPSNRPRPVDVVYLSLMGVGLLLLAVASFLPWDLAEAKFFTWVPGSIFFAAWLSWPLYAGAWTSGRSLAGGVAVSFCSLACLLIFGYGALFLNVGITV